MIPSEETEWPAGPVKAQMRKWPPQRAARGCRLANSLSLSRRISLCPPAQLQASQISARVISAYWQAALCAHQGALALIRQQPPGCGRGRMGQTVLLSGRTAGAHQRCCAPELKRCVCLAPPPRPLPLAGWPWPGTGCQRRRWRRRMAPACAGRWQRVAAAQLQRAAFAPRAPAAATPAAEQEAAAVGAAVGAAAGAVAAAAATAAAATAAAAVALACLLRSGSAFRRTWSRRCAGPARGSLHV